jgi:ribosomal protein S18 acetylase RimI-like enzyme
MDTRELISQRGTRATGPGLLIRPYAGPIDHAAMAAIGTAALRASGRVETARPAQFDNDYANLVNCDPYRHALLIEVDGEPQAYGRAWWSDRTSGERAFEAIQRVRPDGPAEAVGRALLVALEGLTEAMVREVGRAGRPTMAVRYALGREVASQAFLGSVGYRLVRRSFELVRGGFDDIPELPLPDGFEVRSVDPADAATIRRVFEFDAEVFRDHWGEGSELGSEASFRAFIGDPSFDPRLWQIAWDGDRIAGHILNFLDEPEADGTLRGWTESIAVGRPYRRRGLASALLARSLRTVRDAGATEAALGVDAQNENRALDLYQRLGFRIVAEDLEYHRPIARDDDPTESRS